MLGKLVHKFKKQSLQDQQQHQLYQNHATIGPAVAATAGTGDASGGVRKSARLNPTLSDTTMRLSGACSSTLPRASHAKNVNAFDSGTESDDDELERLDPMSRRNESKTKSLLAEKQTFNDGDDSRLDEPPCGTSPPTLTSSPPLISEIDTSSWDSIGCESGIVLRESVERDDSSRDFENSLDGLSSHADENEKSSTTATPVHRQDYFPAYFGAASKFHSADTPLDFSALRDRNGNRSAAAQSSDTDGEKGGAFRPVVKHRNRKNSYNSTGERPMSVNISQNLAAAVVQPEQQQHVNAASPNNLIGEKRRWTPDANTPAGSTLSLAQNSPIASRTRGSLLAGTNLLHSGTVTGSMDNLSNRSQQQQEEPRAVLTARRTRVRVLYHEGQQQRKQQTTKSKPAYGDRHHHYRLSLCGMKTEYSEGFLSESSSTAPVQANKRGRLVSTSSSSSTSAPKLVKANSSERPSLDFDKMRERMMSGDFTVPITLNNERH